MTFQASRFWGGGLLAWTKILMPDRIELKADRAIVTKKTWLGLAGSEEEVPYRRIASVRLVTGLFTGTVIIETTGGATADLRVKAFAKKVAQQAIVALRAKMADKATAD